MKLHVRDRDLSPYAAPSTVVAVDTLAFDFKSTQLHFVRLSCILMKSSRVISRVRIFKKYDVSGTDSIPIIR